MPGTVKDIGASDPVRHLAISKEWNQEFDPILTHDKIERLLYRFVQSHGADRFVLNGSMLLMTWFEEPIGRMHAHKLARTELAPSRPCGPTCRHEAGEPFIVSAKSMRR